MDYEKKYKEAIERLRNAFYDNNNRMCEEYRNATLKIIEPIFPEIAEPEDERIREKLLSSFKSIMADADEDELWYGLSYNDIITWLEKQGKQKQDVNIQINPSEYINDMGGNGCYLKNTTQASAWSEEDDYNLQCMIAKVTSDIQKGNVGRNNELIDWLESLKDRAQPKQDSTDRFFEGFKKGEQSVIENFGKYGLCKPTKWSEEDELHIRELEDLVKRVWAIAEHENHKETIHQMSDLSFFLKTLKPQLKQEWSKDDEDYFDAIIAKLEVTQEDAALTDNQMNFLKSLKNRVQPKREWSEEEQQTIKDAASFILSCVNIAETKEEEERLEKLAGKLQDLKPQPHWKPTKEQMDTIEAVVNDWSFQRLYLNSLYEQLKKLRELS